MATERREDLGPLDRPWSVISRRADPAARERFEFGRNWSRFLAHVDEDRIRRSERALKRLLRLETLQRRRFLDIGSGSGLSSLAARRLGATVHSFDCDPGSVACTAALRARFFPGDPGWTVGQGSILDAAHVRSLGTFDIVYAWGVLHHTGDMWTALDRAHRLLAPGGLLAIAIYNDMGSQSERWRAIKRCYNRLPSPLRPAFVALVMTPSEVKACLRAALSLRPADYRNRWTQYSDRRGMSKWRDMVDWVGGYPYEVAKPEEIFDFYRARGFTLVALRCGGTGLGCNEYVFQRSSVVGHRSSVTENGEPRSDNR